MAVYTVDAALTASDPANNQFKTIQEAIDAARGADPQSEADRITIEIKASAVEYTGVNVAGMSNSVLNLKDAKFITLAGAGAGTSAVCPSVRRTAPVWGAVLHDWPPYCPSVTRYLLHGGGAGDFLALRQLCSPLVSVQRKPERCFDCRGR